MSEYPWLMVRKPSNTYYLQVPVPQDIQESYGRPQIWKSLRTKDRKEAVKKWRIESAAFQAQFDAHRRKQTRFAEPPFEQLSEVQIQLIGDAYYAHLLGEDDDLRLDGFEGVDFDEHADDVDDLDDLNRQEYARGIQSEFMKDEAREVLSWDHVSLRLSEMSSSWPKLVRAIQSARIKADAVKKQRNMGEVVETPKSKPIPTTGATLEDAKDFYIAEKVSGSEFARKKNIARIERMMANVRAALVTVPAMPDWTIDDAYRVRDYLLAKGNLKPASVRRELNTIRGVFSLFRAKKLRSMENPFSGLELPESAVVDKDARDALPQEVIQNVRGLIIAKSNPEIRLIWRLLEGTGCRLAEVAGLRVQDIVTDGELPHLKIVGHGKRRLKTGSSTREVPLVGDALEAAKEAIQHSGQGPEVFVRYSGPTGPNTASAVIMKYVRKVTTNPLHTAHSLRHNLADRCDLAEVNPMDKSAILGHLNAGTSENHYGSRITKLRVLTKSMKKAFGLAE